MPNYSLLFARSPFDAELCATNDWGWERADELHSEFRRPDSGERVRYVQDLPGTLQGFRWDTRVYLGFEWYRRSDATKVVDLIASGFFRKCDPQLPPPRPRRNRDADVLSEVRRTLTRLEKR